MARKIVFRFPCWSLTLLQSWPDQPGLRNCRGRVLRALARRLWTGHHGVNFGSPLNPKQTLCSSVQFSSVAQSCLTRCDPMNCSTPGLPVHHQLPEFTQTHVYRVGDAIQPSHSLSSPSPPAPNPS